VRIVYSVTLILLLSACGPGPAEQVETLRVSKEDFDISLLAKGELRAAESTPIKPPPGSTNPRTISWLAPNYSAVRKGQVIARFDVSNAEQEATKTGIELTKVDIQVMAKQRELERLLSELGHELELVDIEKLMAEKFVVEDTLAYSRLEIIDATRNKELLDYRSGHLENKKGDYSEKQNAEIEVLDAVRATQESKNLEHRQQIEQAEVLAPHDGFLVYEKTWWGQQVDIGSTVFPGNKIASIPNLDNMEAVLRVLETEAVGLAEGQKVDLKIDAFPDRPLNGKISSISATAAPINRESPVKYFTVTVALEKADPDWITPEAQVTAVIHINRVEDTIAIPNQALFQDAAGDWVLIRDGNSLERRKVTLGLRDANRSQVTSGLESGDEIALYPPAGMDS
jgi:multidrug efflux pump subunit AcrA (membrane-fusion protein)